MTERIRSALPPLFDFVTPMPYVALQQLLDEANGWGSYAYDKGGYFADLTDEVIEVLTEHAPRKTSPMSLLLFYRLDGAYSEVAEEATAFSGGRSPRFTASSSAITPTAEMLPAERDWVRSLWQALQPHMLGGRFLRQRRRGVRRGECGGRLRPEVPAAVDDQGGATTPTTSSTATSNIAGPERSPPSGADASPTRVGAQGTDPGRRHAGPPQYRDSPWRSGGWTTTSSGPGVPG